MTQLYAEDGTVTPVTKITVDSCFVSAKKMVDKDGYSAIQIVSEEKSPKNINKPLMGLFKKVFNKEMGYRYVKEFRLASNDPIFDKIEVGQEFDASIFVPGDIVTIKGKSKGRGFQGVVKRHGFAGSPKTHGHKDQLRMPGSIGAGGPQRVFKGVRMGGHMGDQSVTVANLEVIKVDSENNAIYVKGAIPGARNSVVYISGVGEFEPKKKEDLSLNNNESAKQEPFVPEKSEDQNVNNEKDNEKTEFEEKEDVKQEVKEEAK